MVRSAATSLLLCGLFTATSSVCLAQRNTLPTAPQADKKPREILTKVEAEAIMGQPAEGRSSSPFDCWYVEPGWTNGPPKNQQVRLTAHINATSQPSELADSWKNMADDPMPTRTSKPLPSFVDGANWNWYQGHGGELFAYKAGMISASAIISDFPEEAATDYTKRLAAKIPGGSEATGYVYNTPKIMLRMDKPPCRNCRRAAAGESRSCGLRAGREDVCGSRYHYDQSVFARSE